VPAFTVAMNLICTIPNYGAIYGTIPNYEVKVATLKSKTAL
jgi:hypothetical protein